MHRFIKQIHSTIQMQYNTKTTNIPLPHTLQVWIMIVKSATVIGNAHWRFSSMTALIAVTWTVDYP